MGSFKLRRLKLPKYSIDVFENQNIYTCKDALSLTLVELQSLLGISYKQAVEIRSIISRKCVSEPSVVYNLYENQKKQNVKTFFSSSLYDLDMLLQGGLLLGSVTEIAGPPGVGKTQFCFMLSILATLPTTKGGLNGQVIYIDTESAFSGKRLKEMAESRFPEVFHSDNDIQHLLQRIFVHKATSVFALKEIVPNIEIEIIKEKVKLVIIDSIASLFRKEYGASIHESIIERNNILLEQAAILKDIAQTYGILVFLTNQITSHSSECDSTLSEYFASEVNINEGCGVEISESSDFIQTKKIKLRDVMNVDYVIPALGSTWFHSVNTRLVARFLNSQVRELTIMKSPVAPNASVRYILNETGLALTDEDEKCVNIVDSEHLNIYTKYNFLTDEITGTGMVF